jgi:hypothetical protein
MKILNTNTYIHEQILSNFLYNVLILTHSLILTYEHRFHNLIDNNNTNLDAFLINNISNINQI